MKTDFDAGQVQNQSNRQQKKRKGNFPKTDSFTVKKEPMIASGIP